MELITEARIHTAEPFYMQEFWDCACQLNYTHHTSVSKCAVCGRHQSKRSASRFNEFLRMFGVNLYTIPKVIDVATGVPLTDCQRTQLQARMVNYEQRRQTPHGPRYNLY